MVIELERAQSVAADKIWIPEAGTFDRMPCDSVQGGVYKLSTAGIKSISEAAGFTARFESELINTAYLDIVSGNASFTLEISKNSRPADIAVRYTRGQWVSNDISRSADLQKNILKTSYQASSLTSKSIAVICDELNILEADFESLVIRVNFKAETATLLVDQVYAEKLPAESFSTFSVSQGNVSLVPIEIGENMSPVSPSTSPVSSVAAAKDVNVQINSDSWKYSTYSQSEVDRLLKIQAENITTGFAAKISAQQKFVQETIAEHEKAMRKLRAELSGQMEQLTVKASTAADAQNEKAKTLVEKTQNEFEVQFEQVKADLDRTLMNDLKGFDKKLQSLESTLQTLTQTKQSGISQQTITLLVALSVVLSLANMVLLFVHH
jgi:hypothetical protein